MTHNKLIERLFDSIPFEELDEQSQAEIAEVWKFEQEVNGEVKEDEE
jgi:hypothetical protein